jgi:hypothetical protein
MTEEETDQIMRDVQALSPDSHWRQQVFDMLDRLNPAWRKAWEENNPDWEKKLDAIFVDP